MAPGPISPGAPGPPTGPARRPLSGVRLHLQPRFITIDRRLVQTRPCAHMEGTVPPHRPTGQRLHPQLMLRCLALNSRVAESVVISLCQMDVTS